MKIKPFTPGIRKFLGRLRRTKRNWIFRDVYIRIQSYKKYPYPQCPICYLAKAPMEHTVNWWEHYQKVGITRRDAELIASSADKGLENNPELRKALLDACGLEETK